MQHKATYHSPIGDIVIASDDIGIVGVWFVGQKNFGSTLEEDAVEKESGPILEAEKWLDAYFNGERPMKMPKLHLIGTPYQVAVWNALLRIPYGKTATYQSIAEEVAKDNPGKKPSARAVGSAVRSNPISILVPCHRVIGSDGSLTGYAGGLKRKKCLLKLEGANVQVS
jgi:methylated-DNA-[protein]-cysteine S-methyltransferase